jgi:hypothetical protein
MDFCFETWHPGGNADIYSEKHSKPDWALHLFYPLPFLSCCEGAKIRWHTLYGWMSCYKPGYYYNNGSALCCHTLNTIRQEIKVSPHGIKISLPKL